MSIRTRMRDAHRRFHKRFTQPVYGNTLGFRINRAYARHAARCGMLPGSRLDQEWRQIVPGIVSPEQARAWSDRISAAKPAHVAPAWRGSFVTFDGVLFADDLPTIMSPPLDAALRAFFGGHYWIPSIDVLRTYPFDGEPHGSYCWHADNHPRQVVKLMLYLTETDETGGGTAFLDRKTTRRFVSAGYDGAVTRERVADLTPFARKHGIPFSPLRPLLKPGDGVIFQGNVLHKGVLPTKGFRDVINLFFLPSRVPWQEVPLAPGGPNRWMTWLRCSP